MSEAACAPYSTKPSPDLCAPRAREAACPRPRSPPARHLRKMSADEGGGGEDGDSDGWAAVVEDLGKKDAALLVTYVIAFERGRHANEMSAFRAQCVLEDMVSVPQQHIGHVLWSEWKSLLIEAGRQEVTEYLDDYRDHKLHVDTLTEKELHSLMLSQPRAAYDYVDSRPQSNAEKAVALIQLRMRRGAAPGEQNMDEQLSRPGRTLFLPELRRVLGYLTRDELEGALTIAVEGYRAQRPNVVVPVPTVITAEQLRNRAFQALSAANPPPVDPNVATDFAAMCTPQWPPACNLRIRRDGNRVLFSACVDGSLEGDEAGGDVLEATDVLCASDAAACLRKLSKIRPQIAVRKLTLEHGLELPEAVRLVVDEINRGCGAVEGRAHLIATVAHAVDKTQNQVVAAAFALLTRGSGTSRTTRGQEFTPSRRRILSMIALQFGIHTIEPRGTYIELSDKNAAATPLSAIKPKTPSAAARILDASGYTCLHHNELPIQRRPDGQCAAEIIHFGTANEEAGDKVATLSPRPAGGVDMHDIDVALSPLGDRLCAARPPAHDPSACSDGRARVHVHIHVSVPRPRPLPPQVQGARL